jgi:hypothetical protein
MRTILVALVFCGISVAAPAPQIRLPKPIPSKVKGLTPRDFIGNWTMYWGFSASYDMELKKDGQYTSQAPGSEVVWVGDWYYDGIDTLHISEKTAGSMNSKTYNKIKLQRDKNGFFNRLYIQGRFIKPDGWGGEYLSDLIYNQRKK